MLKAILTSLLTFICFLIIHISHFHFFNPYNRVESILIAAFLCLILFLVLFRVVPSEDQLIYKMKLQSIRSQNILSIFFGMLFFGFLFLGYLEFYFTADRSITFRMMRIVDERPTQNITASEMLSEYNTDAIIHRRMDDLVYGGYFKKEDEKYFLTTKGHFVLGLYRFTIDFMHMNRF